MTLEEWLEKDWVKRPTHDSSIHWLGLEVQTQMLMKIREYQQDFRMALEHVARFELGISTEEVDARRARFQAYREAQRFFEDFAVWVDEQTEAALQEGMSMTDAVRRYIDCSRLLQGEEDFVRLTEHVPAAIRQKYSEAEAAIKAWESWIATEPMWGSWEQESGSLDLEIRNRLPDGSLSPEWGRCHFDVQSTPAETFKGVQI